MRTQCIVALLALGLVPAARAQDRAEESFSLDEAVDAMRRAHPLVIGARATIDAAEGDAIDAGLWANPSLGAIWTQGVVQSSYDPAGYTAATLSQFVEIADAPGARRRAAELVRAATEADLDALVVSLSLDLEQAFVEAAAARERLRVLGDIASSLHEVARVVRERVAAGAAPHYDASRIALTVAMADADVATARADVIAADAELRASIGPAADALRGAPRLDLFAAPALPAVSELLARLRDARPDLVALDRRARAAEESIAVATRSVLPGALVQLGVGFGQTPGQLDVLVGLSVPIPVIDYGQGSIRASEARAEVSRASRASVLSFAERRLAGAAQAAAARRDALAAYLDTLASTDPAMRAEAHAAYLAGRMSVLELADAHLAIRDTELRSIELAVAARSAEVELGRIVGASLRAPGRRSAR